MESAANPDSFELFVKALGRASDKLLKRERNEGKMFVKEDALSNSVKKRILSAMKNLDKTFDESDKRLAYSKQRLYELTEMPGRYNTEINDFLSRIEKAINSYIEEKRDRERRIKQLEQKIRSRVTRAKLKRKVSETSKGIDEKEQLRNSILTLKKRYYRLAKGRNSPENRAKLNIIRKRIYAIEKKIDAGVSRNA